MNKRNFIRISIAILALVVIILGIYALQAKTPAQPSADPATATFTLDEVRAANEPGNCLVAIEQTVYDLSAYAADDEKIRPLCGTDATEAVAKLGTDIGTLFAPVKAGILVSAS